MRQRNVKDCETILKSSDKYILNPEKFKGKWKTDHFKKVYLEIGIGKGSFIMSKAKENKNILFIGIELNKNVASLAIKKIARYENIEKENLTNLKILTLNALQLEEVFSNNEIDKIYLNFSDPWPKARHEKRRLTSDVFIDIYKKILKQDSLVEMKTDNRALFEYTIKNISKNNMKIKEISLDLHKDIENKKVDIDENIITEYEERFSKLGPIYKIIFNF